MSRSASIPPDPKPKRPTIRARRPTLPPLAPPPRREDARKDEGPRRTLPPMPVLPMLGAPESSDALMDETQVRPADEIDLDSSVPGITEVRSALRFNRRRRIPASELFEASTNKIDRHRLLRDAGLLSIKDETTAPTLNVAPPAPPPHARSTMQVAPGDLERMRRLSETLEKDSVPVLELVDSIELSQDDLVDDESLRGRHVVAKADVLSMSASRMELGQEDFLDDESETLDGGGIDPETLAGPVDFGTPRGPAVSDPELQAFRGNEDWGLSAASAEIRIASGGRPLVGVTGETPLLGASAEMRRVRFAEESDGGVLPANVSFEDDRSPVPDLRPESLEVAAYQAPATLASPPVYSAPVAEARPARVVPQIPQVPQISQAPQNAQAHAFAPGPAAHGQYGLTAPLGQVAPANMSSGFAPLNPGTKLRTPGHAFVPQTSVPQAYPALSSQVAIASAPSAFPVFPHPHAHPRAQESGPIPTTSNDVSRSRVEKPSWTAPLLFVAVLVVAVFGAYFVLGPRLVGAPPPAAAAAPTPSALPVAPAPLAPAPTQPAAAPPAPVVSADTAATLAAYSFPHPSATAAPAAPPAAPKVAKGSLKPAPAAPAPAKKTASGPSALGKPGPVADDGPKPAQAPPASAPEPALPNLSGLGDVLNGAL